MGCSTTDTLRPEEAPSGALALRARSGDQGAVAELYRRAWPRALAAVRASCGHDEAEDAVAEGFARAFARLHQIRDPAAVEVWLSRSAVRASLELARRRRRVRPCGGPEELPGGNAHQAESAAERVVAALDRAAIAASVGELPPDLRHMVRLRYVAGLSVREVATRLALPEGTVRRRCFDARRLLRQRFLHHNLRPATGECKGVTDQLCRAAGRDSAVTAHQWVERHLRRCPGCRARRTELEALADRWAHRRPGPSSTARQLPC